MTQKTPIEKQQSWKLFDQIAEDYDLTNHILSFGLDFYWRKQLCKHLPKKKNLKILDLATGTCDVLITLLKHSPMISEACGIDLSEEMLTIGKQKLQKHKLDHLVDLKKGTADEILYENDRFNAVTMAYGIRNMQNPLQALKESFRVLAPRGKLIILEFSLPKNLLIQFFHRFYLKNMMPRIGGMLSGHPEAYRYLHETIASFPYGESFVHWMKQAGFKCTKFYPLSMGITTIYVGEKE